MKKYKVAELIIKIIAVIATVLFGVITVGGALMKENEAAVNRALNIETTRIEQGDDDENADTQYYKSSYDSVAEAKEASKEMIRETMEEGAVLLKNENNALPLKQGASISLYSASSVDPIITGTGSSGSSNILSNDEFESVDLKTAFEEVEDMDIAVNPVLWDFYEQGTYARRKSGAWGAVFSISDAPWSSIPASAKNAGYDDAAIFVLSRRSGEGNDMGSYYADDMIKSKISSSLTNDVTNGNYLALSPNEISVLEGLKAMKDDGTLKSIIVLMNTANPVQCDFIDDEAYGIDAMLWCGTLGDTGSEGVANIMCGKANPSGRLSDTFWKYHYLNPVAANFAIDQYNTGEWTESVSTTWLDQEKVNSSDAAMKANMQANSRSTVYAEGIYVGYRYTETRYEDYIFGRDNTGSFDYYENVSYPFGYGLSYTTFEYSDLIVSLNQRTSLYEDNTFDISVTVKNTGDFAGKEVVQIYLQKPYTDYDEYYEIEKASVELVAFDKTDILEPGESQTLHMTVNESELTSYDTYGYGTYILEDGDYYFTAATDAHDAINNIIDYKSAAESTVHDPVANGITGLGNSDLVDYEYISSFDASTYSVSYKAEEAGLADYAVKIENQFEKYFTDGKSTNILDYEGATSGFSYITRSDWEGTVKLGFDASGNCLNNQVKVTVTDEMYQIRKEAMSDPDPDYGEVPDFGVSTDTPLVLIDLRSYDDEDDDVSNDVPIEYDNSTWDVLLSQLTWDEVKGLLSDGYRLTAAIESIAKPETIDFNGSVGLVTRYNNNSSINRGLAMSTDDPDKNELLCFYPCNGVCASTFNKELMEQYGEQWGEDGLWSGISGLYGMGINIHRSPYGGRNFEYYSEDSELTGQIAAEIVKGAASKGMYCYLKHCVCNDQETYRIGGYVWFTEQTVRELYLKPFQIAIEEGGASSVMTAEPALGLEWSGQQGFVQTVLRDEFGMTGIAVSDYLRDVDGNFLKAILAGSDLPDGTYSDLFDSITLDDYGDLASMMKESAHHILYTVVHSSAMNGFSSNTKVIVITPWWIGVVDTLQTVFTVVFAVAMAALIVDIICGFFVKDPETGKPMWKRRFKK
ncbi:MAG: glycoside hydrolase family 3 C-terminal domain-containing protein [Clostridia bacterium]|nr:glycoside hydrolase family 3 C-terminal domain-containing protein [Clostridia bacterium]